MATGEQLPSAVLRQVAWRDLVALTPVEVVRELLLPVPWLAASLAAAAFSLYPWPRAPVDARRTCRQFRCRGAGRRRSAGANHALSPVSDGDRPVPDGVLCGLDGAP